MTRKFMLVLVLGACMLGPVSAQGQNQKQPAQKKIQIEKIIKLLEHENAKVRSAAAFALGNMGANAYEALDALVLACGDKDAEVEKAAMEALKKITGAVAPGTKLASNPNTAPPPPTPNLPGKAVKGSYTIDKLAKNPDGKENLMHHKKVYFHKGTTATIHVKSDKNTDVDLYVDNPSGVQIREDITVGKDCTVTFQVPESGDYTLVVDNLGNEDNRCVVTYEAK